MDTGEIALQRPPQDEVYTKIEHLTSTLDTASACLAAYGFPSAYER